MSEVNKTFYVRTYVAPYNSRVPGGINDPDYDRMNLMVVHRWVFMRS